MKSFTIYTLGCKLNQTESDSIRQILEDNGGTFCAHDQQVALAIINTCAVTSRSERRARQIIRRQRRQFAETFIAVIGCYAQHQAAKIAADLDVDLVLGTSNRYQVVDYLGATRQNIGATIEIANRDADFDQREQSTISEQVRSRAYLKVQDGCDSHCSYCIIPQLRGASCSYPVELVIERYLRYLESGFREVVITGVNIGYYGRDLPGSVTLTSLLKELWLRAPRPDIRIRLSSLAPNMITEELCVLLATSDWLAPHIHLSLQSASDRILAAMNRKYQQADIFNVVARLRQARPKIALGADFIVGFPGESAADFQETCQAIFDLDLAYVHVFSFSPRPDTRAAQMKSDLSAAEKAERSDKLRQLARDCKQKYLAKFVGQTVSALVEINKPGALFSRALAGEYFKIKIPLLPGSEKQLIDVLVTGADQSYAWGKQLNTDTVI